MARVIVDLTVSLDGFVAAANDGVDLPLGDDGMPTGPVPGLPLHVVPVLLGSGVRLFDHFGAAHIALEILRVVDAPGVTHLRYAVRH